MSVGGIVQNKIVVVGQGYVGLPLAMRAVQVGYEVVGVDLDPQRVAILQEGKSYVEDVPDEVVKSAINSGSYRPTARYKETAAFDVAIIAVPTPLRDSLPDLSYIESSARSLARNLKRGSVVILESTTYPGTTEQILVPILEEESGMKVDEDFYVGYSPERIDPGNKDWGFVETPKVVSGTSPESLRRVQGFYDQLVNETVPVSGTKEAELTKLLENTFRHVNIALVNELAIFAYQLGVNIWDSIEAASTKPFGFMKFTPGPGVGGHCLPVDPSYLSWEIKRQLGQTFRFVELANDVNDHMPRYVAERIVFALNKRGIATVNARVLLIGVAYKKNTGDTREAPAFQIINRLEELGCKILAADPHVSDEQWPKGVARVEIDADVLASVDAAVILADHDAFDLSILEESNVITLDTKNALRGAYGEQI